MSKKKRTGPTSASSIMERDRERKRRKQAARAAKKEKLHWAAIHQGFFLFKSTIEEAAKAAGMAQQKAAETQNLDAFRKITEVAKKIKAAGDTIVELGPLFQNKKGIVADDDIFAYSQCLNAFGDNALAETGIMSLLDDINDLLVIADGEEVEVSEESEAENLIDQSGDSGDE